MKTYSSAGAEAALVSKTKNGSTSPSGPGGGPYNKKEARAIPVVFRPDDPIRPEDDIVLRAGGGSVDNLVQRALDNAPAYAEFAAGGLCPSPYTISVHVPREHRASKDEILASPQYARYGPYLEAPASSLLELSPVTFVATTITHADEAPTLVDLCHYDVVIEAATPEQLTQRIQQIRERFVRHDNPAREVRS